MMIESHGKSGRGEHMLECISQYLAMGALVGRSLLTSNQLFECINLLVS